MEDENGDRLIYLAGGPLAAVLLGMALVPLRGVTTASNFTFVFMALTILVAELGGRGAAVATALCSALSLDFFLTQPYMRLAIADKHDLIAFVGLTVCGLIAAAVGCAARRAGGRAAGEPRSAGARPLRPGPAREGRRRRPRPRAGARRLPRCAPSRRGRRPRHPGQPRRCHRAGSRHAGARPELATPGGLRRRRRRRCRRKGHGSRSWPGAVRSAGSTSGETADRRARPARRSLADVAHLLALILDGALPKTPPRE